MSAKWTPKNNLMYHSKRSGRTRTVNEIHAHTQRGFLNIDAAFDWALSGAAPKKLFDDKFLDGVRSFVAEKEQRWEEDGAAKQEEMQAFLDTGFFPQSSGGGEQAMPENPPYDLPLADAVHILQARLDFCDFNAGFVLNSFGANCSKYLTPQKLVEALFSLGEKLQTVLLTPPTTRVRSDEEGESAPERVARFWRRVDHVQRHPEDFHAEEGEEWAGEAVETWKLSALKPQWAEEKAYREMIDGFDARDAQKRRGEVDLLIADKQVNAYGERLPTRARGDLLPPWAPREELGVQWRR